MLCHRSWSVVARVEAALRSEIVWVRPEVEQTAVDSRADLAPLVGRVGGGLAD
jgi:hypothetical protein